MKKMILAVITALLCMAIPASAQSEWNGQTLAEGRYYIYNKGAHLFLSADKDAPADSPSFLTGNDAVAFTITAKDDKWQLSSDAGNVGIVIATNAFGNAPTSVQASVNASDGTAITATGDETGYTFSVTKEWKYLFVRNLSYTAYLTAQKEAENDCIGLVATAAPDSTYSQWILVSEKDYVSSAQGRQEALTRLSETIAEAKAMRDAYPLPTVAKTAFSASITAAETVVKTASSWLSGTITANTIVSTTNSLKDKMADLPELSRYYVACKDAVSNIQHIDNGAGLRTIVATANTALEAATGKQAMLAAMLVMRSAASLYVRNMQELADSLDFTGFIGNHSFETGDMAQWYGIDISNANLSSIKLDDPSSIASLVKVGMMPGTVAKEYETETAGGRYYMESNNGGMMPGQMVFQALAGLPSGIWELKAGAYADAGLLRTNKFQLTAIIVPEAIVRDVVGDVTGSGLDIAELIQNINISEYISTFLSNGRTYSTATDCSFADTLTDATLRFATASGDLVLLGMNAGIAALVGTSAYRADDVRLTYCRQVADIMDIARETYASALGDRVAVEANCTTGEAFTYDPKLAQRYNGAHDALRLKRDSLTLNNIPAVLNSNTLNRIEDLNLELPELVAKDAAADSDIAAFAKAAAQFDSLAFIAPLQDDGYNIFRMEGDALTVADGIMSFAGQVGQTFHFAPASEQYRQQMYVCTDGADGVLYLAEHDSTLCFTADADSALVLKVVPSYQAEGVVALYSQDGRVFGEDAPTGAAVLADAANAAVHTALNIVFDEEYVTGLNSVGTSANGLPTRLYDLMGRPVRRNARGIVISGGRLRLVQ